MNRLKEIRIAKGYTLQDVSEATGYTKSFISQLERGLKNPSIDSLRKIASFLNVPVFSLLEEEGENEPTAACQIITPEAQQKICLSSNSPVVYQIFTPNNGKSGLTGFLCHIGPGESSSGQFVCHHYAECTYVMSGEMTALIGEERHIVSAGSSIYVEPEVPHNFLNETGHILTLFGVYYA